MLDAIFLRAIEVLVVTFGQILWQIGRPTHCAHETIQRPPGSALGQRIVGHAAQAPPEDLGTGQTGSAHHLLEQVAISRIQMRLGAALAS